MGAANGKETICLRLTESLGISPRAHTVLVKQQGAETKPHGSISSLDPKITLRLLCEGPSDQPQDRLQALNRKSMKNGK